MAFCIWIDYNLHSYRIVVLNGQIFTNRESKSKKMLIFSQTVKIFLASCTQKNSHIVLIALFDLWLPAFIVPEYFLQCPHFRANFVIHCMDNLHSVCLDLRKNC